MPTDPFKEFTAKLGTAPTSAGGLSEAQLCPPVCALIEGVGAELGHEILTQPEANLDVKTGRVRPDIAIHVDGLICGYIELKKPGKGARPARFTDPHDIEQWKKLQSLPNLIYTDGEEWGLYHLGKEAKLARTDDGKSALMAMLEPFLKWEPHVPSQPKELAHFIAPLTRLLRSEVEEALKIESSPVSRVKNEWQSFLFPDTNNAKFADAYAQTVTYALLLARLEGADDLEPTKASAILDKNKGLLARALEILGQDKAREQLRVGFDLLKRSLEKLNIRDLRISAPDIWIYFYEDFLAAYDPKLRDDYGVYYTPREVVELQVRLANELLDKRFKKQFGFADDGVMFLDPAVGTGTYLVEAVRSGLEKVEAVSGAGAIEARARQIAKNMHGFEILVGPYAVAHLRLAQAIESKLGESDKGFNQRLKVYLADTLESPNRGMSETHTLTLTHEEFTEEHENARQVKKTGEILVCLGNPPYNRQQIEHGDTETHRKGGWVRFGDQTKGGAKQDHMAPAIFDAFTAPVSAAGLGGEITNLHNDYVYFWRWALWRLFEQQSQGGIITFITASSYLEGPGFFGMRKVMRETFDELWIIDLEGGSLGSRKTANVFNIQTPVAIAIGMRGKDPDPENPAKVNYTKVVADSREDKLSILNSYAGFSSVDWEECPTDWTEPFKPENTGEYFSWPSVGNVFPLHLSGINYNRSWPIGETREILQDRYYRLIVENPEERSKLFKETRDRNISWQPENNKELPTIYDLSFEHEMPHIAQYAFRSFDRHYAIMDIRFGDLIRPELQQCYSGKQIFFTTLSTDSFGEGPAMTACAAIPDRHHFKGSFGGKIIPLYSDSSSKIPNIAFGLLDGLKEKYGFPVSAESLFSYTYALLGGQSYTRRFWDELGNRGARLPLTKDGKIFKKAAALGEKLIWLHTYAERFQNKQRGNRIKQGKATNPRGKGVPLGRENYPKKYSYDGQNIHVGNGVFGPVSPEIWNYEVSGLKVVQSWLGYRMEKRKGKKSSPLDDIRPQEWTAPMSHEFLELLWVLEATLDMEPDLAKVLDEVVAGECFKADELPKPTAAQRKPPKAAKPEDKTRPRMI